MKYYLGIDVGTTGTKSMLFNYNGDVISRGYKSYPLNSPYENWFEQNPEDWYNAVIESVKEALNGQDYDIESVSFSAQGGSFFLADLDEEKKVIPLTPALTWMDKRASKEASELSKLLNMKIGAGSQASRIKWLQDNQKEVFDKTKIILTTSDYLYYKFTNTFAIDYTSCAITGLFDIENNCWHKEILKALNISENLFPKLVKAGEYLGEIKGEVLKEMGIEPSKKIKVFCGAHDQYAANIGSNYFEEDDLIVSTGTTWVVFGKTQKLPNDFSFLLSPHPINGYGIICSAVSSGSVIEWEKKVYSTDYSELNEEIAKKGIEKDLLVYPFVSGSGAYRGETPLHYSARNLSFRHDKFDIIKASMEGVCFEIKEIINRFNKIGLKYGRVIVAGGATKSPVWMQILSSVLNEEIYISNYADRCCFGAYAIAKKGITNKYETFKFEGYTVKPIETDAKVYAEKFEKYSENI